MSQPILGFDVTEVTEVADLRVQTPVRHVIGIEVSASRGATVGEITVFVNVEAVRSIV